jgi:FdhD protein
MGDVDDTNDTAGGAPDVRLDAVEEAAVWLDLNGSPAVTWMCTPERLDELVVGWLFGEGYIDNQAEIVRMRPCTSELGFWVEVPLDKYDAVERAERRRVLASGCGAVTTILGSMSDVPRRRSPSPELDTTTLRKLFKELFARGERYKDTGGIHAAALVDGSELVTHAEDIGRHNAVDKAIGAALLARRRVEGMGMLVTGRISAELALKASRAGLVYTATPSVPSTLAVEIARRSGMVLVGRAVSGRPQIHATGAADAA